MHTFFVFSSLVYVSQRERERENMQARPPDSVVMDCFPSVMPQIICYQLNQSINSYNRIDCLV